MIFLPDIGAKTRAGRDCGPSGSFEGVIESVVFRSRRAQRLVLAHECGYGGSFVGVISSIAFLLGLVLEDSCRVPLWRRWQFCRGNRFITFLSGACISAHVDAICGYDGSFVGVIGVRPLWEDGYVRGVRLKAKHVWNKRYASVS